MSAVEIFSLWDEFKILERGDGEICHRLLIDRSRYQAGIVRFRRPMEVDPVADPIREITHAKVDTMVYVLGGDGTLSISGESLIFLYLLFHYSIYLMMLAYQSLDYK